MRMSSIEIKYWEEKAIAQSIKNYEEFINQYKKGWDDTPIVLSGALETGKHLKEIRDAKAARKQ